MFLKVSLVSIFICFAFATQYVPIQEFYDGIHQGGPGSKLHIEAFYDLLCPFSKSSNAMFNEVFSKVDSTNVKFTIHIFPLPYHNKAHTAAIGARFIVHKFDHKAAFAYINHVFDTQDSIDGSATFNKSQAQVVQEFAQDVSFYFQSSYPQYSFTQDEFILALQNRDYDLQARASWKYGCSRGVPGTPLFIVNGVVQDGASDLSVEDWINLINVRSAVTQ